MKKVVTIITVLFALSSPVIADEQGDREREVIRDRTDIGNAEYIKEQEISEDRERARENEKEKKTKSK